MNESLKENIRVGPCDHKTAWGLIILSQITAIFLIVISVIVPVWAKTSDTSLGLYQCTPCEKNNYQDQRIATCAKADFAVHFKNSEISNRLDSGCKMFNNLEMALYVYGICASAAVFFTLVWILSVLAFCSRSSTFFCGIVCGFLSGGSQILAVFLWFYKSNTSISTCSQFPNDGRSPELCNGEGTKAAMAAAIWYIIVIIVYAIIGKRLKDRLSESEKRSAKIFPERSLVYLNIERNNSN